VSNQNPQNWADYNSRPSVPVQFFLNIRPRQPRAQILARFQAPALSPRTTPKTALAFGAPICYIHLNS
jgi:hypothetical protein